MQQKYLPQQTAAI